MMISYVVDDKKTVEMIEKETKMKAIHGFFRASHCFADETWSVFNGNAILTNAHLSYATDLRIKKYGKEVTTTGFPEYFSVKPWECEKNGTT